MKRILSLVLAVIMIAAVMCGCSEEYSVKVSKSGKTKLTIISAIPVETVEDMLAASEGVTEETVPNESVAPGEKVTIAEKAPLEQESAADMSTDTEHDSVSDEDVPVEEDIYGGYDPEDLEDMEIEMVDGVECYVDKKTESFSSTSKANKHMLKEYGEDGSGYFEAFKVTTKQFTATTTYYINSVAALMGGGCDLKLSITLPYTITKTNGTLSDDKKTVTFDLLQEEKLYAYTTKSSKSAKVYFKKDYLKSNSSAYLDWNTVKGAKKYKLQYKASGDEKWKSVTTTKTATTVTNLKAGKKYTFKVTAITKSKEYTSIKTYITTLKKVSASVKSKTAKTVKLSWKKNTNADGYIVYMKTSKSGDWKSVKTVKDPYTTKYTVKKLKSDKKYYFKVVSYSNENGKKVKSSGSTISAKTK